MVRYAVTKSTPAVRPAEADVADTAGVGGGAVVVVEDSVERGAVLVGAVLPRGDEVVVGPGCDDGAGGAELGGVLLAGGAELGGAVLRGGADVDDVVLVGKIVRWVSALPARALTTSVAVENTSAPVVRAITASSLRRLARSMPLDPPDDLGGRHRAFVTVAPAGGRPRAYPRATPLAHLPGGRGGEHQRRTEPAALAYGVRRAWVRDVARSSGGDRLTITAGPPVARGGRGSPKAWLSALASPIVRSQLVSIEGTERASVRNVTCRQ